MSLASGWQYPAESDLGTGLAAVKHSGHLQAEGVQQSAVDIVEPAIGHDDDDIAVF